MTHDLAQIQAAFQEAIRRYPTDVEGALIFFASATGMTSTEPNDQDIEWAKKEMERHGR
jgi:hypothetical protein